MKPTLQDKEEGISTTRRLTIKDTKQIKLLMYMPGVGIITGFAIFAEVGDFARFKTPESLNGFAGLVPRQRSSGGSVHMGHITKTGSKVLRYSL